MPAPARVLPLAGLALGLLAGAGCGHKGPPIPPLPRVPETPREFAVRQRGARIEITAEYHLTDRRGGPLRAPVRPELLYVTESRPDAASGWTARFRDREYLRTARVVPLPELPARAAEDSLRRNDAVPLEAFEGDPVLVLALAVRDARARSGLTPRIVVPMAIPPLAPLDALRVTPREQGIELAWEGGDARAGVVRIYRRGGEEPSFPWEPWKVVPLGQAGVRDEAVTYGQTLVYAATTGLGETASVVESEPVVTPPVLYEDVFPPEPARDVVAVAVERGINVLWVPARSTDLSHALVERQDGDEAAPWREVGRVDAPDAFFADHAVEQGKEYRYRVISVDRRGNRSEAAGPTAWSTPRPPREPGR